MGKIILYGIVPSPPVRAVLFTLHELGLEFEFVEVNPLKGEQFNQDFIKKNPQHTIPMLEDDGHCISDSHAIIAYLCRKFGKTDLLYPKDFYQRAVVDNRLHFESGILFACCLKGLRTPNETLETKTKNIEEAYDFMEAFLEDGTHMAGNSLTIADLSILPSLSSLDLIVPVDSTKWPKLNSWLDLMKKLPYYEEVNVEGLRVIGEMLKSMLESMNVELKK
ncbi:glutathione S-transferase 1-like [Eupeodes corollae]|uniref:glutathione S-transferase 1-like n=1 Tax=Eupeodes corollae TaxID=290404 RepID=UPI0024907E4B|nr:glutathione S-transferase 1-like [Eupeodes corollae]